MHRKQLQNFGSYFCRFRSPTQFSCKSSIHSRLPVLNRSLAQYERTCFESDFTIPLADCPIGWVNGHHPDDFKLLQKPLDPQLLWNKHDQLWFRVSFKVGGGYLPASLLVHTGAPSWLYIGDQLYNELQKHRRIGDDYTIIPSTLLVSSSYGILASLSIKIHAHG